MVHSQWWPRGYIWSRFTAAEMSLFERLCNKVEYIYREYEFLTATCVMDVWERRMVNLTLVSRIDLVLPTVFTGCPC